MGKSKERAVCANCGGALTDRDVWHTLNNDQTEHVSTYGCIKALASRITSLEEEASGGH